MLEIEQCVKHRGAPALRKSYFTRRTILKKRIRRGKPTQRFFGLPESFDSAQQKRIEGFIVLQQVFHVYGDYHRNLPAIRKLEGAVESRRFALCPHSFNLPPLSLAH